MVVSGWSRSSSGELARLLLGVVSRMLLSLGCRHMPSAFAALNSLARAGWCPHDLKFVFLLFLQDVHLPPQAFLRVRCPRSFRHALVRIGHGTVQPRKHLKVHPLSQLIFPSSLPTDLQQFMLCSTFERVHVFDPFTKLFTSVQAASTYESKGPVAFL
jgi:hypothetical protein